MSDILTRNLSGKKPQEIFHTWGWQADWPVQGSKTEEDFNFFVLKSFVKISDVHFGCDYIILEAASRTAMKWSIGI